MPRLGPLRRRVGLKLSDVELAPVLEIAEAEHDGNLSAAIWTPIAEAVEARVSSWDD